jgi:hypothetical protein
MRGLALVGVLLGGCSQTVGSSSDAASDGTHVEPYTQTLPDGPCAVEGVTGAVPGVTLAIRSASCVYKRGTPAAFTLEVTTTGATPAITLPNTSGCSDCRLFSSDPASFTRARIQGTSAGGEVEQYCECDYGCCAPTHGQSVQLDITTTSTTFNWTGREWDGPSDTGNAMGDFFLPGRYSVNFSFSGFDQGSVEAMLPIEIVL